MKVIEERNLTPRQIVEELDKYIIGQADAKKNVAIAIRNRWRRMNVKSDIKGDIIPNNILMIGATGVGKTEIARRIAKVTYAPFTKVEASKFTEVGYVGRGVRFLSSITFIRYYSLSTNFGTLNLFFISMTIDELFPLHQK